ncbi:MAG: FtsQ-type POTRA domain-containing protein [Cyanobium sp.]
MSTTPAPPGSERRRQLRQQRRRERLLNLWRLLVLLALSAGLGYGLLRQGWVLSGPDQVEVVGSQQVGPEQVVQAAKLSFPQPLLGLQPKRIAEAVANSLPVEQVQVSRLMAPPRLRVELVDRQAVARAQRRTSGGIEQGFIDRFGHWMSIRQGQGVAAKGSSSLTVVGWQPRHRPALALVLDKRAQLGGDLRQIRFEPGGSLWLESARLGQVRLGPTDGQLGRRLEVLGHLQKELPAKVKGRKLQSIDLSDPEQPELGLPAPASPPTATTSPPR